MPRQDSSIRFEQPIDDELNQEEKYVLRLIAAGNASELSQFLRQSTVDVTEIWEEGGFTLLHLGAYKNSFPMVQLLVIHAIQVTNNNQPNNGTKVSDWINAFATGEECFTALHFAAFNDMLKFLVENGGNTVGIHSRSSSQVTLFHVAAQGDHVSVMAYLRKLLEKTDPQIIDRRDVKGSTALHWACYVGSENAVQFLLAWGADPNSQDNLGLTPLHNAVKSSEEIKSARSVRMLLIKGAERGIRDNLGRRPIDLAHECMSSALRNELIQFLEEPNLLQKFMIQTPLKKIKKSYSSVITFIVLYVFSFLYVLKYILSDENVNLNMKVLIVCNFLFTSVFFILSWQTDPGYLKADPSIDFLAIIQKFEPHQLCADCELIKTKRSRHCNVCNRCVERYDHHCPWINNCVGYRNHAYFYIYIVSLQIYILSVFSCIVSGIKLRINLNIQNTQDQDMFVAIFRALNDYPSELWINLMSVTLLLVSMIFMIPLLILVCVQTKNMMSNETTSERFSKKKEQSQSASSGGITHQEEFHEEQDTQPPKNDDNMERIRQSAAEFRRIQDASPYGLQSIVDNCIQMSCTKEYESQEELLKKQTQTTV